MRVAVIGGGASGLVCAIALKKSDKSDKISVTVFESNERVGKKLLATGNGRCNIMNSDFAPGFYSSPSFVVPATDKFDVRSNLDFLENLGLYTREDSEGRIYPMSNQASGVLDVLRLECDTLGIRIVCGTPVKSIEKRKGKYIISEHTSFDAVVLACGSPACVKNYFSYDLLCSLGHSVVTPRPSLTKIGVAESNICKRLKGIRCKVRLTLKNRGKYVSEEKGELLFTDYGLSGIAIMQLSAFIARDRRSSVTDFAVKVDFVPEMNFDDLSSAVEKLIVSRKNAKAEELLWGIMPKRLGEELVKSCGIPLGFSAGKLTKSQVKNLVSACKGFVFNVKELKGFADAQVASGGASLSEFDPFTLESEIHKGLYCCGEMLDVDGLCGGYNLMWAISGARLCAESIARKV